MKSADCIPTRAINHYILSQDQSPWIDHKIANRNVCQPIKWKVKICEVQAHNLLPGNSVTVTSSNTQCDASTGFCKQTWRSTEKLKFKTLRNNMHITDY